MSSQSTSTGRAAFVAGAPLLLFTALALHPYLPGRQPNVEALAAAVSSDPNRWGLVHLATGVGSAVLAVAFLLVRTELSGSGENRWSRAGLPLVMVGCALYAMLPAMEFAPLAAVESGADPAAAQEALLIWFRPLLIASGVTFGAGAACFAMAVTRSGLVSKRAAKVVAAALVVIAVARFVPLSAVQFYVQGLACYAALLPLAYRMWRTADPRHVPQGHSIAAHPQPPTRVWT